MSTLAAVAFTQDARSMPNNSVEIDGVRARALVAAYEAYREKMPDARIEQYIVHVRDAKDGNVQVVFEPRQAQDVEPTLGGRTALGRELNVWVSTDDYAVEKVSFAR